MTTQAYEALASLMKEWGITTFIQVYADPCEEPYTPETMHRTFTYSLGERTLKIRRPFDLITIPDPTYTLYEEVFSIVFLQLLWDAGEGWNKWVECLPFDPSDPRATQVYAHYAEKIHRLQDFFGEYYVKVIDLASFK